MPFGKKSTRSLVKGGDAPKPEPVEKKERKKREKAPKPPRESGKRRINPASSRIVIAITSLLLAAFVAVVLLPRFYRARSETTSAVRVRGDVAAGAVLTRDMLVVTEVGVLGLPEGVVRDVDDAVGMTAKTDLCSGEFLYRARIAQEVISEPQDLKDLEKGMHLMTVTPQSIAAGVGGVLRAGDIVDAYEVAEKDDGRVSVTKYIQKLHVIDVFNSALESLEALDKEAAEHPDDSYDLRPAAIVVRCTDEQALVLMRLEAEGSLHFTLIGKEEG